MRKITLFIITFAIPFISGFSQNNRAGLRFTPLNSAYTLYNSHDYNSNQTTDEKYKEHMDSLTIGAFYEKYFEKSGLLIRADINYADLKNDSEETYSSTMGSNNQGDYHHDCYKQKFININLGLGTRVNWSKFTFSFGAYIPFTILPKGTQTRDYKYYSNDVETQYTTGSGKYKGTLGIGIGAFAGVSITVLKHLSIGLDAAYSIQYLKRSMTWHGETHYLNSGEPMSYADETETFRNFYTSKIIPSIVVAWAFNCKKNVPSIRASK